MEVREQHIAEALQAASNVPCAAADSIKGIGAAKAAALQTGGTSTPRGSALDLRLTAALTCASLISIWYASSAEPSLTYWVAAISLISAGISSIVGFAFSAIAGVGLSMLNFDPERMVRIFAIGSVTTQLFSMAMLRCDVQWGRVAPVAIVGLLTAPLGLYLLRSVSPATYMIALGATIASYSAYMLLRRSAIQVRGSRNRDLAAGGLAGIIGGFAALPVSSLAIYCQLTTDGKSPAANRAFYQPAGTIIQVGVLIALYVTDRSHAVGLQTAHITDFFIVPIVLLATQAGVAVFRGLDTKRFALAMNLLLLLSGLALVLQRLR